MTDPRVNRVSDAIETPGHDHDAGCSHRRPDPSESSNTERTPADETRGHVLGNGSAARELDGGRTTPDEESRLAATFGRLLRTERRKVGLSLRQTARALGISPSYLSRLERGQRRPRFQTCGVIAAYLTEQTGGDRQDLKARLIDAAGDSIRPDTERSETAWARRGRKAFERGDRGLPPHVARLVALHQAQGESDRLTQAAFDLNRRAAAILYGTDPTSEELAEVDRLNAQADALMQRSDELAALVEAEGPLPTMQIRTRGRVVFSSVGRPT